jgi:hypothetical protein
MRCAQAKGTPSEAKADGVGARAAVTLDLEVAIRT